MNRRLQRRLQVRPLEDRVTPTTFMVLNLSNADPNSLRDCISKANAAGGLDEIQFAAGLAGTITLVGEMNITEQLTITGPGPTTITVSGNNGSRIFSTKNAPVGSAFSISGLSLINGTATTGGGIDVYSHGLTLTNVVISNCKASQLGTAVNIGGGTLNATDCTFKNNTGGTTGAIRSNGNVTLTRCTISGNSAVRGAGLYIYGALTLDSCTISNNVATGSPGGGGITQTSLLPVTMRNTTLSGNSSASVGGGLLFVHAGGIATIQNCTITGNSALSGGGGVATTQSVPPEISMESSIVAGNTALSSPDFFTQGKVNAIKCLIGNSSGITTFNPDAATTSLMGKSALLGPLANNGGPTLTHTILVGSPCIDAGSNPAALTTDQRGLSRVVNNVADIGALELNPRSFLVDQPLDESDGNHTVGDLSLREALLLANEFPGTHDSVTFDFKAFQIPGQISLTLGQLVVSGAVDVSWVEPFPLTINANSASRVVSVDGAPAGAKITLTGLRLTGGKVSGSGGAIIAADEILTLNKCVLTGNQATTSFGGAVALVGPGSLTANDCQFTNNRASSSGGAIIEIGDVNSKTTLNRCTISGNTGFSGGGVYARGFFLMDSCAVFNNTANDQTGGGLHLGQQSGTGTATIRNSTIAANTVNGSGGGIALISTFGGTLLVQNCTITDNQAKEDGGGIVRLNASAKINLASTIVSGNSCGGSGPDIRALSAVTTSFCAFGKSEGFSTSGSTNLAFGLDLKLGPLQLNGGPTFTRALLPGSPALDKGSNPASLNSDQRGGSYGRSRGNGPDIGAYETAKVFLVTNTKDSGAGSLRQAVSDTNTSFGTADLIRFDPILFSTTQSIVLATGDLSSFESLEIQGPGADLLEISGDNKSRIFLGQGPGDFQLHGLTFTKGQASHGGAITTVSANLIIRDCVLTGNSASSGGGAIDFNSVGTLTMQRCEVSNNSAGKYGGGLYFFANGAFNIADSTISGNKSGGEGGGLYFFRASYAPALLSNSTVSGNSAVTSGGGIALNFHGRLLVQNSTIANNSAAAGGGIARFGGTGSVTIRSTIIAQNTAGTGPDLNFNTASTLFADSSIIGVDDKGSFTLTGLNNQSGKAATPLNAKLLALGDFGGPTLTHGLMPGSPALDKGSNPGGLIRDQRGLRRDFPAGKVDVGAFEDQPLPAKIIEVKINDGNPQRSRVTSLVITFDAPPVLPVMPITGFELIRHSDLAPVTLDRAVNGNSVTLTFTGGPVESASLADGRYTLTALATQIVNLDANGDGLSGDDFVLASAKSPSLPTNIFRIFGDSNGDGAVNNTDLFALRLAFGSASAIFDFNGDGQCSALELFEFRLRFGSSV